MGLGLDWATCYKWYHYCLVSVHISTSSRHISFATISVLDFPDREDFWSFAFVANIDLYLQLVYQQFIVRVGLRFELELIGMWCLYQIVSGWRSANDYVFCKIRCECVWWGDKIQRSGPCWLDTFLIRLPVLDHLPDQDQDHTGWCLVKGESDCWGEGDTPWYVVHW